MKISFFLFVAIMLSIPGPSLAAARIFSACTLEAEIVKKAERVAAKGAEYIGEAQSMKEKSRNVCSKGTFEDFKGAVFKANQTLIGGESAGSIRALLLWAEEGGYHKCAQQVDDFLKTGPMADLDSLNSDLKGCSQAVKGDRSGSPRPGDSISSN